MKLSQDQMHRAARVERDRAMGAYLKAKRRHRGVPQARSRMENAVAALARVERGQATSADLAHLNALVNPVVADPIAYIIAKLGLSGVR